MDMGNTEESMWIIEISQTLDDSVGPAVSLWRVPNVRGEMQTGVEVLPPRSVKGRGRFNSVRADPSLSFLNPRMCLWRQACEVGRPLTPRPTIVPPASSILPPAQYENGFWVVVRFWWLNQCQEIWGRSLVTSLARCGTTCPVTELFWAYVFVCKLGLMCLRFVDVVRIIQFCYLGKLLNNSRCWVNVGWTQGKIVQS